MKIKNLQKLKDTEKYYEKFMKIKNLRKLKDTEKYYGIMD